MMNTAPCQWTIYQIAEHMKSGPVSKAPNGNWEPARPYGFFGLRSRLRLAWDVFRGRADALYWPGQMPKAY